MKKSFVLLACVALAFAACTEKEVERQAIGFTPLSYRSKASKAIITDNKYPTSMSFGLYSYHTQEGGTTAIYQNNVVCSYSSDVKAFAPTPAAYWPLSGTLTFMAWSPSSQVATYALADKQLSITDFQVSASASDPVDLLYAEPVKDKTLADQTTSYTGVDNGGKGIGIVFKHALSQVIVRVKLADEYTGAIYKVTDIKLTGLKDKATLTVKENRTPIAEWSTTTESGIEMGVLSGEAAVEYAASFSDAQNKGNAILVMPQTLDSSTQQIAITYSMTYNDVTSSATKIIDLVGTSLTKFEMGKKYYLNLTISADQILYAPEVENWEAGETQEYNI